MSFKIKLLLAVVLLPTLVWAGAQSLTGRNVEKLTSEKSNAASSPLQQNSSFVALGFEKGYRYAYSFERQVSVRGMGNVPQTQYQGELYLDIFERDSSGFQILVTAKRENNTQSESLLWVTGAQGSEMKIFGTNLSPNIQDRNVLRDLLSQFAFMSSEDTVGKYIFSIVENSVQPRILEKQKKSYLGEYADSVEIVFSRHRVIFDSKNPMVPAQIMGREETRLTGGTIPFSTFQGYEFRLEKISELLLADLNNLNISKMTSPIALQLELDDLQAADEERLAKSWQNQLELLKGIEGVSTSDSLAIFGELSKIVRKDKEYATKLLALLSQDEIKAGANSKLFRLVVGVLATAGGNESESALELIYDGTNYSGKTMILNALNTTQAEISEDMKRFLADVMMQDQQGDLSQAAALALGSSWQKGKISERHLAAVETKLNDAHRKQEFGEARFWLDVMGNSGREEFLPLIKKFLSDPVQEIRAKALVSLRLMNSIEAAQLIVSQLSDKSHLQRAASIQAIENGNWQEIYLLPLAECARNDSSERLRSDCKRVLESRTK